MLVIADSNRLVVASCGRNPLGQFAKKDTVVGEGNSYGFWNSIEKLAEITQR